MADSPSDRAALSKAAEIISTRAKEIASTRSRRIPAATHVTEANGIVQVKTEGSIAPNAAPFEAGELHPLWARVGSNKYNHGDWGRQPLFPYMMMAAEETLDQAAEAYGDSLYAYVRILGWR
jgi:hypothetical protein